MPTVSVPALTSFASVAAALAAPDALADALLEPAELEQPARATTIKAAAATAINFFFIAVLLVLFLHYAFHRPSFQRQRVRMIVDVAH